MFDSAVDRSISDTETALKTEMQTKAAEEEYSDLEIWNNFELEDAK
jgi:hypothetical protein